MVYPMRNTDASDECWKTQILMIQQEPRYKAKAATGDFSGDIHHLCLLFGAMDMINKETLCE